MKTIGLDIGTTSICGVVTDPERGELLQSVTLANDSSVGTGLPFARCQAPERILRICKDIVNGFLRQYPDTDAIGLTGQMHGVLCLNDEGEPVSPLYTWQDERGGQPFDKDTSYAQELSRRTGYPAASGYGFTTLFYNTVNGLHPKNAKSVCTVHDYVAMKLCGKSEPVMHLSDAASLGLFDLKNLRFDTAAIEKAGLDKRMLPQLTADCRIIGETKENIPVCVPLGDNQASVLGSLCEGGVLVNVGTGSQVSVVCDEYAPANGIEYRPFLNGRYLMTGCALAGGYSYSLLRNFFAATLKMFGMPVPENAYDLMNRGAECAENGEDDILCEPYFCGTRNNPAARGAFSNIGRHNFSPERMTLSVLKGICDELYSFYDDFRKLLKTDPVMLVGSGNGIRKNGLLRNIFSEKFGMPMRLPLYEEEAAFGCSFAACAALENISEAELRNRIRYR